jgi:alpha-beta hydrolase superfamily lysophospholipase/SAM-dependent methyltransferase
MFSETEGHFKSWDGTELFYRSWSPEGSVDKAIIVIHRGHEHSGRLTGLVNELNIDGAIAFAFDARGHGNSPGERGYAESFDAMVRDLEAFSQFISAENGIEVKSMAVVANSVGAVIASTWVHDYAPPIRGMVLAAPAFRIKLYVPLALPALRLWRKIKGKFFIKSYVKSKMLTHDKEQSKLYDEDPLITRNIAANVLLDLHDTATRIIDDAQGINVPTLILSAGSDWVVEVPAQIDFHSKLESRNKDIQVHPGMYHGIMYEKDRSIPISKARDFVESCFKVEPEYKYLIDSDKRGPTKLEYDLLKCSSGIFKKIWFAVQKLQMKTLGRMSEGIRLGLRTGFDSGETLDYVYENKPRGLTLVGRLIDKVYLSAIGWRGIRKRRENLEQVLKELIQQKSKSENIGIMDIACGGGRYILRALNDLKCKNATVLLRDWSEGSLETAKKLASALSMDNVECLRRDAFDRSTYTEHGQFDIGIASGLYELFPENQPIIESLLGIHQSLKDEGHLIYTGQPWHPQVEMIARTLINRDKEPWVMRRRCQAEMDELVKSAGFEKIKTLTDPYGIFTVSVARKISK